MLPETEREKVLLLERELELFTKSLAQAEARNVRLESQIMTLSALQDQPQNKTLVIHLIEIIKMLLVVGLASWGVKYGIPPTE